MKGELSTCQVPRILPPGWRRRRWQYWPLSRAPAGSSPRLRHSRHSCRAAPVKQYANQMARCQPISALGQVVPVLIARGAEVRHENVQGARAAVHLCALPRVGTSGQVETEAARSPISVTWAAPGRRGAAPARRWPGCRRRLPPPCLSPQASSSGQSPLPLLKHTRCQGPPPHAADCVSRSSQDRFEAPKASIQFSPDGERPFRAAMCSQQPPPRRRAAAAARAP